VPRRFAIDIDEPFELGGGNAYANPQKYLLAALNACIIVGYAALCALQGITLEQKIHQIVLATSPNFYNITRAVRVMPELVIK